MTENSAMYVNSSRVMDSRYPQRMERLLMSGKPIDTLEGKPVFVKKTTIPGTQLFLNQEYPEDIFEGQSQRLVYTTWLTQSNNIENPDSIHHLQLESGGRINPNTLLQIQKGIDAIRFHCGLHSPEEEELIRMLGDIFPKILLGKGGLRFVDYLNHYLSVEDRQMITPGKVKEIVEGNHYSASMPNHYLEIHWAPEAVVVVVEHPVYTTVLSTTTSLATIAYSNFNFDRTILKTGTEMLVDDLIARRRNFKDIASLFSSELTIQTVVNDQNDQLWSSNHSPYGRLK